MSLVKVFPTVDQNFGYKSVAISDNGAIVYALTSTPGIFPDFFRSLDAGKTFVKILDGFSGSTGAPAEMVICSSDGSHIFIADGVDIRRSTDYGVNFDSDVGVVFDGFITHIACSDDGSVLYVNGTNTNTNTHGLYRSTTPGTYEFLDSSQFAASALTALACSTTGEIVFTAQNGSEFYKSTNFGGSFVGKTFSGWTTMETISCSKDGVHVYIGGGVVGFPATKNGLVEYSSDSGVTFTVPSAFVPGGVMMTDHVFKRKVTRSAVSADGRIVAFSSVDSTDSGLANIYKSEDYGETKGADLIGSLHHNTNNSLAMSIDGATLYVGDDSPVEDFVYFLWVLFTYEEITGGIGKFVVKTASGINVNTVITDDAREFIRDVNFGDTAPASGQFLQFDGQKWNSVTLDASTEKAYIFASTSNGNPASATGEQEFDRGVRMQVKTASIGVPVVLEGSANTTIPASPSFITVETIDVSTMGVRETFPGNTGSNNWDINLLNGGVAAVVNRYKIANEAPGLVYRGSVSISWLANDFDQSGYVSLYEVDGDTSGSADVGEILGSRCYIKIKTSIVGRDHATSNFLFDRGTGDKFYELRMFVLGTDVDEHTLYNSSLGNFAEIKVADVSVMLETVTSTLL